METKGDRRDRKKDSKRKNIFDNRKSVNLIMDLIKRRSKRLKNKSE